MLFTSLEASVQGVYAVVPEELLCSEYFERLPAFVTMELTGGKPGRDAAAIVQHMRQCPECEQVHAALLQTLRNAADQV